MSNPFDDNAPPMPARSIPIGGNPFEDAAPAYAQDPGTLTSNAADTLKAASNTFSFGMRDRLEGAYRALTGEAPGYSAGVDQAVADSRMRRERSPYLSVVGDVAGGTAQAFVPGVGTVGKTVSAALGGAGRGAMPAIARMTGYGLEGGILGAGQAAGNTYTGNAQDYANNAIAGGTLGAVLGAPFGKFADVAPKSLAVVPTSGELKASSKNAYDLTHQIPVAYDAPHFWGGIDALEQQLLAKTNPVRSPSVFESLKLARAGRDKVGPGDTATVSPKNIDDLRQQLTGVAEPGAGYARSWLDSYMQDPAGVVRGSDANRAEIAKLLNNARGDWRAGKRTETIENTNQYAEDRFNTANSAQNAGNTYRQKLVALLNPKSSEGKWYNPSEKADIRDVTRGELAANALRIGGNLARGITGQAAGGGGIAGALATGDLTPLLALGVPLAGSMMKGLGNHMTVSHAEQLADKMAMRSPLYRDRAANAPVVAGPGLGNTAEATRNALTIEMLNQLKLRGYMPQAEE